MSLGKKLSSLRHERGISQAQAAEFLTMRGFSVTQRAVSKWECDSTKPDAEQFLTLCELYGVHDALAVFRGVQETSPLNSLGRRRLAEYTKLLSMSAEFSDSPVRSAKHTHRTIPLYDLPASAGTGQFLDGESYVYIEASDQVPPSAAFAVRLSGDSMTPRFSDGQIVYVQHCQTLDSGECGIFLLNGSAYCKILSENGTTELESINKKYQPIKVGEFDDLRILGRVVN